MKLVTRIAMPVLAGAALIGFAGAGNAAAAEVPHTSAIALSSMAVNSLTQGFDIRNLSSHVITLTGITNPGEGDGTPRIGTVLKPGQSMHYEKVFWFGKGGGTELSLQSYDAAKNTMSVFPVELKIDPFLNIPTVIAPDSGVGGLVFGESGRGSNQVNLRDVPGGPAITISAADKQQQADLLNRLCAEGQAACTFAPTKSAAGPDQVKRKLSDVNVGTGPVTVSLKQSFTFGTTTSVELSGSAKSSVLGLVEVTLAGKYGQGWSQSTTEEITRTFQVPVGRMGILEVTQPMTREYGTFTVIMGNTRWELTDVYFDFPDKTKDVIVRVGDVKA